MLNHKQKNYRAARKIKRSKGGSSDKLYHAAMRREPGQDEEEYAGTVPATTVTEELPF